MNEHHHQPSLFRTWIWLGVMLGIILFKGFLAFYVVSDMGQPTWDYRPVRDVPASSPYAVYQRMPNAQHVRGAGGN
ncbi:conserved hypothetical protein [Desulfosarcina cetonica]|uniref:hypothetical protein n=1 Tax=Desulfosarcina cetonica TaxID=90730 RepID=UPI0006D0FECC|nr:hypothetical protein [Desulfosarcina cetonica]VTR69642.1 conserved hypothetical protein [Desulfosarcina cetonica]